MDLSESFDLDHVNFPNAGESIPANGKEFWKVYLAKTCYIGQPVKISKDLGVLRLALDSQSFRRVVDETSVENLENSATIDGPSVFDDDAIIIKKLAFLAHNYSALERAIDRGHEIEDQ